MLVFQNIEDFLKIWNILFLTVNIVSKFSLKFQIIYQLSLNTTHLVNVNYHMVIYKNLIYLKINIQNTAYLKISEGEYWREFLSSKAKLNLDSTLFTVVQSEIGASTTQNATGIVFTNKCLAHHPGMSCLYNWALERGNSPKSLQMVAVAMKWKKHLLLGRKTMTNLDSILKSRNITLLTNVHLVKAMVFFSSHVWMWELDHKEVWALKNWCFCTVVLEKTLETSLDCKKIKPVHPKGNQSWIFIGGTDAEAEAPIQRADS